MATEDATFPTAKPPALAWSSGQSLRTVEHLENHKRDRNESRAMMDVIGLAAAVGSILGKVRLTDGAGLGLTDLLARRNLARNSRFDSWTGGTSFSASGATADGWYGNIGSGGTPAATMSRQAHTLGDVAGEPAYFYRHNQTAQATSTAPYLEQRYSDVRRESGQNLTISFYAKCSSGTVAVTPRASQNFGTGGSPSATVDTDGTAVTVTTTRTRYARTIAVPAITGKTIGSNADSYLAVQLRFPLSSTYTVDIDEVKVERGEAATDIETPELALERLLLGLLTNADIAAAAGIAVSKLAAGTAGYTLRSIGGVPTWAAPPSALVYNSGAIAVADSTFVPLTFDSERYDTDGIHSTASNTDRLTCVTAGKYSGFAAAQFASNATGYRTMAVYHSGLNGYIASAWQPAVNGNVTALMCPFQCALTAGQYLRVDMFQYSGGGSLNVVQQDYYSPSAGMIWTGP
ncbi:MAG: hypothetical protein AB7P40_28365 [Chloroflexota bacterium]